MAKVLVVDDEPDIVLFAQVSLERHGHEVCTAADGVAALAAVHDDHPDAIILDVMMPDLDGWSVLEVLKRDADEAVRTIPVLMLTALDTDHDRARGGIEGAVRHLTKPVTPDDLLQALDDVLNGPPEPEQRRAAQHQGLAGLARIERHAAGGAPPLGGGPRLSRLEHPPPPRSSPAPVATHAQAPVSAELTSKQRELLQALVDAPSVSAAATALGVSRSNVYASLRRVGRKVGVGDVSELLRTLRGGGLASLLSS
jgi:CheY-like chemotaxis protein